MGIYLTLFLIFISISQVYAIPKNFELTPSRGDAAHSGFVNAKVDPAKITLLWDKNFGETNVQ